MKLIAILTLLTASLVLATPVKRDDLDRKDAQRTITHTFYTTITGNLAEETTVGGPPAWWGKGDWSKNGGHKWKTWWSKPCTSTDTSSSTQQPSVTIEPITTSSSSPSSLDSSSSSPKSETSSSSTSESTSSSSSSESSSSSDLSTSSSSSSSISTTTSSTSSASRTETPQNPVLSQYAQKILDQHNIHRDNHSVPDMTWNSSLAATAQEIADTCVYKHQMDFDGGHYGQNIGAGYTEDQVPAMITNDMYNREFDYYPGYDIDDPAEVEGRQFLHFTQIVWKGSTTVGCATKQCDTLENAGEGVPPYFTVCNYFPQGNIAPLYPKNVLKPIGRDTVWVATE